MLRRKTVIGLSVLALLFSAALPVQAADKTTKYRVYQDDKLLQELSDYKAAEAYARQFAGSHVEEIGTRKWLWNNYPRYKVYQNGYSSASWEFASLDQAIREAQRWGHASVRDLQDGGWVWNNYPKYRVYQGEISLDSWEFPTLQQATAEAAKWANSHIIDLSTHRWVWDNISSNRKEEIRSTGSPVYQVYQGNYTQADWKFALLEDAINESLRWGNSTVVNLEKNKQIVFSNLKKYKVYQYDHYLEEFLDIGDAIAYAKQYDHTKIVNHELPEYLQRTIWNNYPYYQVYQNSSLIGDASTIQGALSYAMQYSNASVRLYDDKLKIWDNFRKLQYWGWNGSSSDSTIRSHVKNTVGMDVDSPTYFQLADADGNLTDTSNKETVTWLKSQGITVYPLVANQFDSALTTQFLANPAAQSKFIKALVDRTVAIGADGINIDFESLNGKDRTRFTQFVSDLTAAAHEKRLVVSIDLPRGSVKWNAQTAFDHEKLAGIVDYIITMTYDQHWKGSTEPGSVAGLQWVEEGVKEFLSYGIPRDKLIMGVPYYVREWTVSPAGELLGNRALLMKDLDALISAKNASLTWDSRFNQYKVEYREDGNTRVFWMENNDSMKARIEIAKKYDLAGVAAWRLGYETADLWKMMLQEK
jgi:spore germination protein YaaH